MTELSHNQTTVLCKRCGNVMMEVETVTAPNSGPSVTMFSCGRVGCERKAAIVYEPEGGMTEEQQTWVEQEIARRGSFFPNDWTGDSQSRFRR